MDCGLDLFAGNMADKLEIILKSASPMNSGTAVPQGALARLGNRAQVLFNGWFGPGEALPAQAPPGTQVRALDYEFGINIQTTRPFTPVPFHQLRRFAREYFLVRMAIEKIEDRICAMNWAINPKKMAGEKPVDYKARASADPRVAQVTALLERPDLENPWRRWIRKLLEDYLVLDAAAISVQRKKNGGIYRLMVVDGATIVRKVDIQGMTPSGDDDVAYQQDLKGLPAIDLSRKDLLYCAENIKPHSLYGFGRVEQLLTLLQLGLHRLLHQIDYYTEGSVPDAFAFLPEGTSANETERWDALYQKIVAGNSARRRKIFWLPWAGKEPIQMKAEDLSDKMDEMLNRYVCFCFGLSPSALVPQVNRATAGQMADDADEAGIMPVSLWVVDTINEIIQSPYYLNMPDLEFGFQNPVEVDNLTQSQIDQVEFAMAQQTGNGLVVLNEFRDRDGKCQLEDKTPEPVADDTQQGQMQDQTQADDALPPTPPRKVLQRKSAVAEGSVLTIDPGEDTPAKAKARKALAGVVTKFLGKQAESVANAVGTAYVRQKANQPEQLKADKDDDELQKQAAEIMDAVGLDWGDLAVQVETYLQQAATAGVAQAGTALGVEHDIFSQANEWAISYGEDRGAELVGMKYVDGALVANPSAQWAITDTTRDKLQQMIVQALEEGTPVAQLKTQIMDSTLFSAQRAEMIATTEVNFANSGGQMEVGKIVGHTSKRSLLSGDHDQDDECDENQEASENGIPIDEPFPSGDEYAPFHPNCVCLTQTFTPGKEL